MTTTTTTGKFLKQVAYKVKEGKLDEVIKAYKEGPFKKMKSAKGCIHVHFSVNRKENKVMAIYIFDSMELFMQGLKTSGAHVLKDLLAGPDGDSVWECVTCE